MNQSQSHSFRLYTITRESKAYLKALKGSASHDCQIPFPSERPQWRFGTLDIKSKLGKAERQHELKYD